MYYSAIGLLALLILVIENQDILRHLRASYEKPAWNVYRKFLLAVLAYFIVDILWGYLEYRKWAVPLFIDTTVYFLTMAAGVLYWSEFTVAYTGEGGAFGRALVVAGRVLAGVIATLTLVNCFTPVFFTVDADCVYQTLPLRYWNLGCQILLLLLISGYAMTSMRRVPRGDVRRGRYWVLAFFGILMAGFLFAQLWFPYLPLYGIAYLLGISLLQTFVASDEKEEYHRGLEAAEQKASAREIVSSLLDNMPGLTFTKDANTGVYLACNQAFALYAHKQSPEGVVGLTDAQIFDPDTAAHFVADDKLALSMAKPYIFFEDVPDAAGSQRQFQTTKLKYTDAAGRLCVLGMCQDVTDLVRVQHESAMTKEAYESAVQSGLMYTHIAQTLSRDYTEMYYVNTDTEEYVEYRMEQGRTALSEARRGYHFFSDLKQELADQVDPEDRESFLQAMARKSLMNALSRKNTFVLTFRQLSGKDSVYVSMKVSRMEEDEHFIIVGMTNVNAVMRDAMAKSEALAEALAAAEEANRTKTRFLSNMSHEIRTPMSAIIGLDSLALKKGTLDPETRDYLLKIGENAHRLLDVINGILEMSRFDSGRMTLRRDAFSLSALLDQVSDEARSLCGEKGLDYVCRVLGEMEDACIGDDGKIRDVLLQLLSNAVKFTDAPGSVTLTAERTAVFEDQVTLRFRVRDTGIGMDPAFLPRVFDAFTQEDLSYKNRYGGIGLGLTIAKRIVEMMNGSISVTSDKGKGSEFTVLVTLRKGDQKEIGPGAVIDPGDLLVLVVDDDPIEAEHARTVLDEVGIQADVCTSGLDALRMIDAQHRKRRPYSLVLMDWNMPGMNGLETSAEIRKQYQDESTIVVLTAYNWDDIQEEAHRVGVDSFLSKPLFPENVMDQFDRIARRSHRRLLSPKRRADLSGRRVLLAEDMAINAEIMMDILSLENIQVDHAENGRIAVELFASQPVGTYTAILMDVRMPEMDGLQATEAIRALPREDAKRIPIVALTANAFDEDVQRSLQAGMNAHLNKPVEQDHLIRVLGELVYEAEK